jgi:hypothetical protein
MSQYYLNIFSDLLEVNPTNPMTMPDPYNAQQSLSTNIRAFYRLIRWSLRTNDRVGSLVNAYYLGYLLEERASTPSERRKCRRLLTKHYILSCTRIYNIYNILGIQQLYRSQRSSYWMFRKITRQEYCQLMQDAGLLV